VVEVMATFAPASFMSRAVAKPIPPALPAPVTKATRPATPAMISSLYPIFRRHATVQR
jgi:hypothetical protein